MAQTIFIRLPSSPIDEIGEYNPLVEWCVSDGIGRPTVQQEPLQAVLQTVGAREVIVLAPGQEIVLTDVDLPIRQKAKFLQAVPYALEEQLAEDVETLHFAVGEKQTSGRTPVLVVSRKLLDQWLAPFKQAGITPKAILVDILCLPEPQGVEQWAVLAEGAHTLVRTSKNSGFACDTEALSDYLSLTEDSEHLTLRVARMPSVPETQLEGLPVEQTDIDASMRFGLEAMPLAKATDSINLLQGSYSFSESYSDWWKPYRFTATLFLAWLLLATAALVLDHFRLKSSIADIEASNSAKIAQLFPEIKTLIPGREKFQLEGRLNELRGSGGQAGIFDHLKSLAQALQSVGGVELQELQLRDGKLFLNMTAKDISTLDKLKTHYTSQAGWELDVQSANASSEGVQIRASLGSAGS